MPSYENVVCPVCGNLFEQGDDIVTCPDCGTPHHRDCYNSIGKCINNSKHGTEFVFKIPKPEIEIENKEEEKSPIGTYYNPFGAKTDGENQGMQPPFPFPNINAVDDNQGFEKGETIYGHSLEESKAVIGSNSGRYMHIFKDFENGKKKLSWNWGAFLFGKYFFFFRKMYPQGILFSVIDICISLSLNILLKSYAPKFLEACTNIIQSAVSSTNYMSVMNSEAVQALQKTADFHNAQYIYLGVFLAFLLCHLLIGGIADKLYARRFKQIFNETEKKLQDEESSINSFFATSNSSPEDFKKFVLSRMGGTNFFIPILVYFAIDLIEQFISSYL